jgi:PHP family Zn ribbon phosphoesterase
MWTYIIVEQKNLLGQQNSALIANCGLQPSNHKKLITACCSAAVQFEGTASIFKEDLLTSIT